MELLAAKETNNTGEGMRRNAQGLVAMLVMCCSGAVVCGQTMPSTQPYHEWWKEPSGARMRPPVGGKKMPLIRVQANRFVDPDGKAVLFRGVAVGDPDMLDHEGHWNKELFEHVQEMGATIVRIPIHPIGWRQRTAKEYFPLLDQAVQWCTDLHLYVIIDWHSIGNLEMEVFQAPMYDTTQHETYQFWQAMSRHFRGNNTVAFYELFNEPSTGRGQFGVASWGEWKRMNEEMIGLIRGYDKEKIELVAGFDWAYDLTPLREEPIAATGVGYVTHAYPNKRQKPWEQKWEEDFGFAAAQYPIIATEIGFGLPAGKTVGDDDYGNLITRYLEKKGISWVAWIYDPDWGPQLLKNWNFELTGSGEFFKEAMHRDVGK
jgi:hypothetical protein